ncbi:MAG: DNA cytosine methyltransferase [Candidatus Muiribacteriota bacterium]
MSEFKKIPVIDLFAGPGGLGEGFSSVIKNDERVFDIKLSIEKDFYAYQTLKLRSFFRKFPLGKAPDKYYDVLESVDNKTRDNIKTELFRTYRYEAEAVEKESFLKELSSNPKVTKLVDEKIQACIKSNQHWVLIGGPPCQAYSLAGRSRVGGIDPDDIRVYLYKEYLRIIAVHKPTFFVMENVKGLLSAKVKGESLFSLILNDLRQPALAFKNITSSYYKVFSLVKEPVEYDENGFPVYSSDNDYLIKSECYGVPQKRHRVILLGVRADIQIEPDKLLEKKQNIPIKEVIEDLPAIRSGLNRTFDKSIFKDGKKKRIYKKINNTDSEWLQYVNSFRKEIMSWNEFAKKHYNDLIKLPKYGTGGEFVRIYGRKPQNSILGSWFLDDKLKGVCNHQSRTHLVEDLKRYMFSSMFASAYDRFPKLNEYKKFSSDLMPDHSNSNTGNFADRFRVQISGSPASTITSHISKDGHYFIHYDPDQCRSLTVREAARIQTFPDNYIFCGPRTAQYQQVGNAVPPYLAYQIAKIIFSAIEKTY